jgi:hypothetical protein
MSVNQIFEVDRTSNKASEPDALLKDEALRQTHNEGHQMKGPGGPTWDNVCLEYFKAKYLRRLQKSHWANGKAS